MKTLRIQGTSKEATDFKIDTLVTVILRLDNIWIISGQYLNNIWKTTFDLYLDNISMILGKHFDNIK